MSKYLEQQRRNIDDMPILHVFPSLFCNLKCPYCSQGASLLKKPGADFLLSEDFLGKVGGLSNVHFVLSGGEPFLNTKGLKNLIRLAIEKRHVLTFHTNLSMPHTMLTDILDGVPPGIVSQAAVSHHLHSNIDEENFIKNVMYLHGLGVSVNVKYLAIPEDLDAISRYLDFWDARNIGSCVAPLMGPWKGRTFSDDYTEAELKTILPMTSNMFVALQFLGGLESKGFPCRAGNDSFSWNIYGHGEKVSCCQDVAGEVDWDKTYFATGVKRSIPCPVPLCWTHNMNEPVARISKEFQDSLTPGTGRRPTIPELVMVARRIETETGRAFTAWPAFLVELSRELGLGTGGEVAIPGDLREARVLSLAAANLLQSLELRSFGGSAILSAADNCVRLKTVSTRDSIRTPFFNLPSPGKGRRWLNIVFDKVHYDLGDFSWRIVVQNQKLATLARSNFSSTRENGGVYVDSVRKSIGFYADDDLPIRLIFAPVGEAEKHYVLSEGLSVSLFS